MFQIKILQISKKCTNWIRLNLLSRILTYYWRRNNPWGCSDLCDFFLNPAVAEGKLSHLEVNLLNCEELVKESRSIPVFLEFPKYEWLVNFSKFQGETLLFLTFAARPSLRAKKGLLERFYKELSASHRTGLFSSTPFGGGCNSRHWVIATASPLPVSHL